MGMKTTMILTLLVAAGLIVAVILVGVGIQNWLEPLVTKSLPDTLPAAPDAAPQTKAPAPADRTVGSKFDTDARKR
ncbi:MAG: hypothetical protein ACYS8W_18980 [Planctomycetota bacterium]